MRSISCLNISEEELKILLQHAVQEAVSSELKTILPEVIRPPTPPTDRYLTRQQVCKMLQISLPTLHAYTKEGLIKAKRIGQTVRYLEKDIHSAFEDIRNQKYRR